MDKSQIEADMKEFVKRIKRCDKKEEAILLRKEIREYVERNNVSDDDNLVLMSGYGESLAMLSET